MFTEEDFKLMNNVRNEQSCPQDLKEKIARLRHELSAFPEFNLPYFDRRIRKFGSMKRQTGNMLFGEPHFGEKYWYLFNVGGEGDQMQLNIGMSPDYLRVGVAFIASGKAVARRLPGFERFKTAVLHNLYVNRGFKDCVSNNSFKVEDQPELDSPNKITDWLSQLTPEDLKERAFLFIGSLWKPTEGAAKTVADFRKVFHALLPFYELTMISLEPRRMIFYPPL